LFIYVALFNFILRYLTLFNLFSFSFIYYFLSWFRVRVYLYFLLKTMLLLFSLVLFFAFPVTMALCFGS